MHVSKLHLRLQVSTMMWMKHHAFDSLQDGLVGIPGVCWHCLPDASWLQPQTLAGISASWKQCPLLLLHLGIRYIKVLHGHASLVHINHGMRCTHDQEQS